MTLAALTAWALLLPGAPAADAADRPGVYGLVIGNNASPVDDPTLAPLRFADDDAARFFELFDRVATETRLLAVLDEATQRPHAELAARAEPPTRAALDRAVSALAERLVADRDADRRSVVYVFFSGHGSTADDGEPFLALLDGNLTQTELFESVIDRLPATRLHLIIDACNAGAMVGVRGPFDDALDATSQRADPALFSELSATRWLDRRPHVGVVLASSAGQAAHEWSRIGSGVFSHEVYSAMVGGGDVNGDRRVEYSEVQAFVAAANSELVDPRARPTVRAHPPAADRRSPLFELGWLNPGPYLVGRAPPDDALRFLVERQDGRRAFDVHLSPGTAFALALPRDQAAYVRTADREARIAPTEGGVVDFEALTFSPRALAERGAVDEELRRGLFAADYGPSYYRGFVDSQGLVPVDFDATSSAQAQLEPELPPARKWAAASWIVGGAALVTGVITGALALEREGAFDDAATQAAASDIVSERDTLRTVSVASFVAAGMLAGLGTALWFSAGPEPARDAAPGSAPRAGWAAQVGIGGRF